MTILTIADERSSNFVDCLLAVSRDFDGYLTGTVIFTGIPVAYITHPDSSYGDADAGNPMGSFSGQQMLTSVTGVDDQVLAHFIEWFGGAREGFGARAAEILGEGGGRTIYTVFDELDDWMDEGHGWIQFMERLEHALHRAFPDEWPEPRP